MNYLYKFFYVFFLYYSKFKNEIPWFGALVVLTVCSSTIILAILQALGIRKIWTNLLDFPGLHKKVALLINTCLISAIYLITLYFVIFGIMKVSKHDGKSPNYEFNPTKRDKLVVYFVAVVFFSLPFIVKGIQMYFEVK